MHIRSCIHLIVLVLVTSTIHAAEQFNSPEPAGYYACVSILSPQQPLKKENINRKLAEAADGGDVKGVEKYIKNGASPNACSPGGTSALCCAINFPDTKIASAMAVFLLEKGARPCDFFKSLAEANGIKFSLPPQAAKSTGTT